jgi:fructose-1,6-bisphosphatase/inositol monophosphatase family enzyme
MDPASKPLDRAVLTATSPDMFDSWEAAQFKALQDSVGLTLFSGDCHNFGLLALGTIDLVVEASLSDYDYLAPAAVIAGAGGLLTDWNGAPVALGSTSRIVAARDPALHAAAVAVLSAR